MKKKKKKKKKQQQQQQQQTKNKGRRKLTSKLVGSSCFASSAFSQASNCPPSNFEIGPFLTLFKFLKL